MRYKWTGLNSKYLTHGKVYDVRHDDGAMHAYFTDDQGGCHSWTADTMRLDGWEQVVDGPVRTVTRREIIPGRYGMVEVGHTEKHGDNRVAVRVANRIASMRVSTAEDLREAAHLFNQLAEVLEENK